MSIAAFQLRFWRRLDRKTRAVEIVPEDGATTRIIERVSGDIDKAWESTTHKNPVVTEYSRFWPEKSG